MIELETVSESGEAPKTRIKDFKSAQVIYEELARADRIPATNRETVHRLIKGEPPLDQDDMNKAGMGWATNVNWLEASSDLEQALSSYANLANSVPNLIRVKLSYGKDQERYEWEQIIAQEYDWLMKSRWTSFCSNSQKTARWFVGDGLAINYWPHDIDWRYEVGRVGQFLFPPDADVDVSKLEIVCQVEDFTPTQLFRMLEQEKKVKDAGDESHINKAAVVKAIRDSCKEGSQRWGYDDIFREFENNGFYQDYGKNQKITLVHYFVKEFSGRVSHYIGRADGDGKDFLYEKQEAFPAMEEFLTFYADGVGEGLLGSLEGIIRKAFPIYQAKDQTRNAWCDATRLSLSMPLQASSEGSGGQELLSQVIIGPLSIFPKGVQIIPQAFNVNAGNQVTPLMAEMSRLGANNTGGYQSHQISPEGGNRTAREATLQAANTATITNAKFVNWYQSETAKHGNVVSRLINPKYTSRDPGYKERMEWLDRITKRGVPLKAIFSIIEVIPIRAIGAGSFQQQQAAFAVLNNNVGAMDAVGRYNLARDASALAAGYDNVDRYLPPPKQVRTPEQAKFAALEHSGFREGVPMTVYPDDANLEHAEVHNGFFGETFGMLQQGQIDDRQAVKQMGPALQHQQQHLSAAQDPADKEKLKELWKSFGKATKMFEQLSQKVQAEAQQQTDMQSQGQPGQPSEEEQFKNLSAQAEIAREDAAAQATQQRLDAEAAARINRENTKLSAHITGQAIKQGASSVPSAQPAAIPSTSPGPLPPVPSAT